MKQQERCDTCQKWVMDCTMFISSLNEEKSICKKCDQKERERNQQIDAAEKLLISGRWIHGYEFASADARRVAIKNLEIRGWTCQKSSVYPRRFVWRAIKEVTTN